MRQDIPFIGVHLEQPALCDPSKFRACLLYLFGVYVTQCHEIVLSLRVRIDRFATLELEKQSFFSSRKNLFIFIFLFNSKFDAPLAVVMVLCCV
jgi:hypothetical protein